MKIQVCTVNINSKQADNQSYLMRWPCLLRKILIFFCNFCIIVIIHNVTDQNKLKNYQQLNLEKIIFTEKIVTNNSCGIIDKTNFVSSLTFYLESLNFNNCLNRKLSINRQGRIQSCPSIKGNLGEISANHLKEALDNIEYQKLANVSKSQIKVCRDCEYRLICSDCRAYVSDIYDKPLSCKYDP